MDVTQSSDDSNEGTADITNQIRLNHYDIQDSDSTGETTLSIRNRYLSNSSSSYISESDISSIQNSLNNFDNHEYDASIQDIQIPNSNSCSTDVENCEILIEQEDNELPSYNVSHFEMAVDEASYDSSDSDFDDHYDIVDGENENNIYFRKLLNLLNSEESNENISARFVVNKIEMLLGILKFSSKYSLPHSATADLCKFINECLNTPILPDTRYKIDQLFHPGESVENHAVCPECESYMGIFRKSDKFMRCTCCNEKITLKSPTYRDFFVVLNVRNELQRLIESNEEYYTNVMNSIDNAADKVSDFYDGRKYKEFRDSLSNENKSSYLTLNFNSDGSPVFESSKFAVWPIQINPNEIPIDVRNKKPVTYAVWFGRKKPDMNIFLNSFVNDINNFANEGINCTINNEIKNIKVFALCCCVDTIARPTMQGFIQFNGYYGCSWCKHPGELVVNNRGATVKYTLLSNLPEQRTEEETLMHIQECIDTGTIVYGVKKATPLLLLNHFNIIDGFVPDSMHCIALGVVKQFTNLWFDSSNERFSVSKGHMTTIDKYIKNFKVPIELARFSRSIMDRRFWTAREWENWLLYYSLPSLMQIPRFHNYAKHWALLVQAVYLLLQDSITFQQLITANNLLQEFVAKVQHYYSKNNMTYNVHQLLHITQSVADWGPLWAHSGYCFERGNGQIVRTVHAANGVLNQICRNLSVKQSIMVMEKHLSNKEGSPILNYCSYLDSRYSQKSIKIGMNRYCSEKKSAVDLMTALNLNEVGSNYKTYDKLVTNNFVYKSNSKSLMRSNNSYALTSDNEFIKIIKFVVDINRSRELTICNKIITKDQSLYTCQSIKIIEHIENNLSIIETKKLKKICIVMNINEIDFISAIPNLCSYSL